MGRESETRQKILAAAIATAALTATTVVLLGPGGLHGVSYWSSSPLAQIRSAEASDEEQPSAVAETGAMVGAARGEADDAWEETPRIPPGQEPMPALPFAVQERLFDAWDRAPVEDISEAPPEPGDADAAPPELVGQAPAAPGEVVLQLARVAGQEAARAFVEEVASLLAPEDLDAEGAAVALDEVTGEVAGQRTDELAESGRDSGELEQDVPLSNDETPETPEQRAQEQLDQAATLAVALQSALVPLMLGAGALPAQAAPPVDPRGMSLPPTDGSSISGSSAAGIGPSPALPPTGLTGPALGSQESLTPGSLVPSTSSPAAPASPMVSPMGPMAPMTPPGPTSPLRPGNLITPSRP